VTLTERNDNFRKKIVVSFYSLLFSLFSFHFQNCRFQ